MLKSDLVETDKTFSKKLPAIMKKIFYFTFLVMIGCNSNKQTLSDSVIMEIPAYNIENDSAVLESIIAASKTKSNDAVFFNNTKYPISKIDSILKSNHETDYSLIVKNDTLGSQRVLFLIPKTK